MKLQSTGLLALALSAAMVSAAAAQNSTRNIGGNNIGNPNPNPGYPSPTPCTHNCYGNGSKEQIIGGIVGGIIGGIIAGSSKRKQQQAAQPQYIQQQPIQQQPVQQHSVQSQQGGGFSQAHYQYCMNRYKSYQIATNSFTAFSGETRYCNSPHN
ncbi:MAG: BA14K family protein [Pseudomonadota bacterium]